MTDMKITLTNLSVQDYHAERDATMSERVLQNHVIDAAKRLRWLCYHPWNSKYSEAGYPDLTLVHPIWRQIIFAELKTMKGELSTDQITWREALQAVWNQWEENHPVWVQRSPVRVYTWRPCHWSSGEIQRILSGEK